MVVRLNLLGESMFLQAVEILLVLLGVVGREGNAIEKAAPGAWTPSVVMGGGSSGNGGANASNLVELMTARTAKELGVDMGVVRGAANAPAKK